MRNILNSSVKVVIVAVCLAAVVAACAFFVWKFFMAKRGVEEAAAPAVKVPVTPIVTKTLFREDQLPGEIEAYQDVLIYPKVRGFVKWIGVDRGSVVKKDDLMVTMYAPEYIASRNEALASLAAARAAVAAEQSRFDDMEADLKSARPIF